MFNTYGIDKMSYVYTFIYLSIHVHNGGSMWWLTISSAVLQYWELSQSRGHNQEVCFTDNFVRKNWSLNQCHSGRYVEKVTFTIETDISDVLTNTCIYDCQWSKVMHHLLWHCTRLTVSSFKTEKFLSRPGNFHWHTSFRGMGGEINTGFHHCHYDASRKLSEQDKAY